MYIKYNKENNIIIQYQISYLDYLFRFVSIKN